MKRNFYLAIYSLFVFLVLPASGNHLLGNIFIKPSVNPSSGSMVFPKPEKAQDGFITTSPISGVICSGSAVVVRFQASGSFAPDNIFTAELSDSTGSFTTRTIIGSAPGSQNSIPEFIYSLVNVPPGSGYRIRVVSSNPEIIGSDNGVNISVSNKTAPTIPTVSVNGPTDFCYGAATTFLTSSAGGNRWFPGGTNTNPFIGVVSSGCYYTQLTGSNGCTTSSVPICIKVNTPIFTFMSHSVNDTIVTTKDSTLTLCVGDSAQASVIIQGGQPPFDITYVNESTGKTFSFSDVGQPYGPDYIFSFYVSDTGHYVIASIKDNFPSGCGSKGNLGGMGIKNVKPPITSFSYNPFCGSVSQPALPVLGFLGGGVYSFNPAPSDGASIDPSNGIISGVSKDTVYNVKYTVQGPFCEADTTIQVQAGDSDIVAFNITSFCPNAQSLPPVFAPGFKSGGVYAFSTTPSDGASINPITGIITGSTSLATYYVQYTSPAGDCQATGFDTVTVFESMKLSADTVNTECGQSNGSLTAKVTGGSPAYSYAWSVPGNTSSISGLSAGQYTLTVTDKNNCKSSETFGVINTNQPKLSFETTNATCGNQNGSINISIDGSAGPFSFKWNDGDSSRNRSGLSAGKYVVDVYDSSSTCGVKDSVTIINQNAPIATFEVTNTLCGQNIGAINVTVTGGTGTISHHWTSGQNTEDISGLFPGTYTDTIRDENNCEIQITASIINENVFTATATSVNPTCGNPGGGSIDVTTSGGEAPFSYSWSPNNQTVTEDALNLSAGEYTVIITSNGSCKDTVKVTLDAPQFLTLDTVVTPATCGNADGAIDLTVTGGTGNNSYSWSNTAVTEDISGVPFGTYTVVVKNQNDTTCKATLTANIKNGNLPELTLIAGASDCSASTGKIDALVSNGSGTYGYSWTGPDGFTSESANIENLAVGEYTLVLNDLITTCSVSKSATVQYETAPIVSVKDTVNTTCGQNNGLIDVAITGGLNPSFTWLYNGENYLSSSDTSKADIFSLASGTYELTVTDENNCTSSLIFNIKASVQPTSNLASLNPSCSNDTGSVNLTLNDATEPVIYSWKKDGVVFSNTKNLTSLSPGIYTVSATDKNGCVARDTVTLVYSNQPTLALTSSNANCGLSNGDATATVTGGAEPIIYQWSPVSGTGSTLSGIGAGSYTVNVTDANGCKLSGSVSITNTIAPNLTIDLVSKSECTVKTGEIQIGITGGVTPITFNWSGPDGYASNQEDIDSLASGLYTLQVVDSVGCKIDTTVTIGTNTPELSFVITDASCNTGKGSIILNLLPPGGGFPPPPVPGDTVYFSWTGPDGFTSIAKDLTDVPAGFYTASVKQGVCILDSTVEIKKTIPFSVDGSVINTRCNQNNGSISLNISGGKAPFTYSWSNGSQTKDITGLAPLNYEVTITDSSKCSVTKNFDVLPSTKPQLSATKVDATCGKCNGSVDLVISSGTLPYAIKWSDNATSEDISSLCAGSYSVTVTDANGCSDSLSQTLSNSVPPTVSVDRVFNTECAIKSGVIDITVNDGVGPFTYIWNGPQGYSSSEEDVDSLGSGTYNLEITDSKGCKVDTSVIVDVNKQVLSLNIKDAKCGLTVGSVFLDLVPAGGGFPPPPAPGGVTLFSWTGPDGFTAITQNILNVSPGIYRVEVTSGICKLDSTIEIRRTDIPTASISFSKTSLCAGDSTLLNIALTGTPPFTFSYSDGSSTQTVTGFNGNAYSKTIKPTGNLNYQMISLIQVSDTSCKGTFPVPAAQVIFNPIPAKPVITYTGSLSICSGDSVTLTSNYPNGNSWTPSGTSQSIVVKSFGTYSVSHTSSAGCTSLPSDPIVVKPAKLSVFAGNDRTICPGDTVHLKGTGADSYLWSPSIGLTGTIIANPVAKPLETTTYILTGTNACGSDTDTVTINVRPVVSADLGEDRSICPGDTITLAVKEPVQGASYLWFPPADITGSPNGSSVQVIGNKNKTIILTTTNTNGCKDADTVNIKLNNLPTAPVLSAQGSTTLCKGDSVILASTIGVFVRWYNGNQLIQENINKLEIRNSGSYSVEYYGGSCNVKSNSISVSVKEKPLANILPSGLTSVCSGKCVTLKSSVTNGSSVSWITPDGTVNADTISACKEGNYKLQVSLNGCSASDNVNIKVNPLPAKPVITPGPEIELCPEKSVTLFSSYSVGNQWFKDQGKMEAYTNNNILLNKAGSYTVQYTDEKGCASFSDPVIIKVLEPLPVKITASDTLICSGSKKSVTLKATPGFATYEWPGGINTDSLVINSAGSYTVIVNSAKGCQSEATIEIIEAPAVEILLYSPIYFDDYNITKKGAKDGSIDLTVSGGSPEFSYEWSNKETKQDISGLPTGTYKVVVTDTKGCTAVDSIFLKEPEAIKLPNAFTPNSDGYNDFYIIKGIQGYPGNQVTIFNRWGNEVYSKKDYVNDWNGISNDGKELPDGTYFIVVDLNDNGKLMEGFIDLRRK